ncbi:ATP-grasp domain-containing protein [Paenibacillus sp. LHD-38]|uniref:ATP-grasp domain-containing protein n=1 Tax=Paenibacillus sp. LHD-38 TaxID=3072143 RepID=UPI00280FD6D8|nr:ATP-grasp domain-containing protein [Paenibacillus sp. LHD-38]MDQ8733976.1 ATP-grasp domain-containing protein [Paenibacillus sp. LHD-38]
MRVLFCSDVFNDRQVDAGYEAEYEKAKELGIKVELLSLEQLLDGNGLKSIKPIQAADEPETAIYKGWMMKPESYESLYNTLKQKNLLLINSPLEYINGHYFPSSYEVIKDATPFSCWVDIDSLAAGYDGVHEILRIFGKKPMSIKDYVKSRKHEWEEACFVPDASDRQQVECVLRNFIDRQGTELSGGIVFREFIELEQLTKHPLSGMPLSNEYRLFFLKHELLATAEYWDEASYKKEKPNLEPFIAISKGISSEFFTMDIAKTATGEWVIIEIGDGQVSGVPDQIDLGEFYKSLKERLGE